MSDDRLEVSVSFDERRGYVAMVPDLAELLTALSLDGLRRRIGAALAPDPETIAAFIKSHAPHVARVGHGGNVPDRRSTTNQSPNLI
jgi:hypothetical protein